MRFLLIDSNAIAYQSYYAFQELRTKNGTPAGALFGFSKKVLNLLKHVKPDHVVAVFDSRGKKDRHDVYAEYKANRKPMPDDMASQMTLIKNFLSHMKIAVVERVGYEADDLIGSLAENIKKTLTDSVIIYTPDKDMLQLIDTRVSVIRSLKDDIEYTPEQFSHEFDMTPAQFIDYLAIMGDASDNIPGVAGIGPKGAKKLIDEFTDIDNLIAHMAEIKNPRVKKMIEDGLSMLMLSRQLVTIHRDIDVSVDADLSIYPRFDPKEVKNFFTQFDFMSLLRLVPDSSPVVMVPQNSLFPHEDEDDDIEIIPVNPRSCAVWQNMDALDVWDADNDVTMSEKELIARCADPENTIVVYDAREFLTRYPFSQAKIYDVRLCEYWHGYSTVADNKTNFSLKYNVTRAKALYKTFSVFHKFLAEQGFWDFVREKEFTFIRVLHTMESHGIAINEQLLAEYETELTGLSELHEATVYRLCGETFNIRSPKQIGEVLFDKMKIEPPGGLRKTKTGFSTDEEVLTAVASVHPVGEHLLEYRKLQKIVSTYVLPYKEVIRKGRLHTSFDYCGTSTGRLSSQNPNLQNIPIHGEWGDKMRTLFKAAAGKLLISADYSQMELRVLAHFSKDPALIDVFVHDRDIHAETAKQLFGSSGPEERSHAKAINFGIVYGQSAFSLADQLGIAHHAARDYIARYFERFKGVKEFIEGVKKNAREKGYVTVLSGRRRYANGITSNNRMVRESAERIAVNTPIQGSAADIIKAVMIEIYELLKDAKDIAMILQVHDELLFEVDADKVEYYLPIIRNAMERVPYTLAVPMKVSVAYGETWKDAH